MKLWKEDTRRVELASTAWGMLALFGGYSLSTEQGLHID
jgi:hypothetical protein